MNVLTVIGYIKTIIKTWHLYVKKSDQMSTLHSAYLANYIPFILTYD